MASRLGAAEKQRARELHRRGWSLREIGAELSRGHETVRLVVMSDPPPAAWTDWEPGPGRLTLDDREEISLGLERDDTFTEIAALLGRAVSTVSREVAANGGREDYRATWAHRRAFDRARRPKTHKLAHPELAAQVEAWLV